MKILCLLLATTCSLVACFIPPAEDVLLFRRDALKLDDNRQALLAKDLINLATRPSAIDDSSQRRATAQLLALAANLEPDSKTPHDLAKDFIGKTEMFIDGSASHEQSLKNISRIILYLLEDSKRKEHFAVAQLLIDPLATIAPDLDIVSTSPSIEESPRWHGAVAPVALFENRPAPVPKVAPDKTISGEASKTKEAGMTKEPEKKPFIKVADFDDSIMVPVFLSKRIDDQLDVPRPTLATLTFEGKLKKTSGTILPPKGTNSELLTESIAIAKGALRRGHDSGIVTGIDGSFSIGGDELRSRSGQILALPMTILAEGLLSERKPLDNLVALGELQKNGTITAPELPWQFLEILLTSQSDEPRRLLIAPQIKPLLTSLLTQRKEEFFFKFDIFEVATLDEAYELSFENSAPENTSQAIAKFQEIRRVGAGTSTSVFVTNAHVLARLAEVQEIEPRHLSAAFLRIRGSGAHPQNHSTQALAAILQSSLIPLAKVPYTNPRNFEATSLEEIHEQCRASLDPLARHVAMGDRELYDNALDLANRVRTLARAKSRYDEEVSDFEFEFKESLLFSNFKAIQAEFYQFATEAASILGQTPPRDPSLPKENN